MFTSKGQVCHDGAINKSSPRRAASATSNAITPGCSTCFAPLNHPRPNASPPSMAVRPPWGATATRWEMSLRRRGNSLPAGAPTDGEGKRRKADRMAWSIRVRIRLLWQKNSDDDISQRGLPTFHAQRAECLGARRIARCLVGQAETPDCRLRRLTRASPHSLQRLRRRAATRARHASRAPATPRPEQDPTGPHRHQRGARLVRQPPWLYNRARNATPPVASHMWPSSHARAPPAGCAKGVAKATTSQHAVSHSARSGTAPGSASMPPSDATPVGRRLPPADSVHRAPSSGGSDTSGSRGPASPQAAPTHGCASSLRAGTPAFDTRA